MISPVLRQAELEIMSNQDCRDSWALVGEGGDQMIQDGMICAGGGEVGPCNVRTNTLIPIHLKQVFSNIPFPKYTTNPTCFNNSNL